MDASGILSRALEILEEKGWTQGSFHTQYGLCSLGAVWQALEEQGHDWLTGQSFYKRVIRALQNQIEYQNVALWNDQPERTYSQVREVFRRAAYEGVAPDGSKVGLTA